MELVLQNLTKRYRDVTAVNGVNITFTPGVWGLLGANGAGKTTLMRMLCGLLTPTSGRVLYGGVDTLALGENWRAALGYLPQHFGFYPGFTVEDYLQYIGALKGFSKAQVDARMEELLPLLRLTDVRTKLIRRLSGGTQRRVGIAQALLGEVEMLVLDEPTSGLDPGERAHFRNLLSELGRSRIVLISTHIVSDVESVATRNALMKNGKLVGVGTTEEMVRPMVGRVWECRLPPAEADALEGRPGVQVVGKRGGEEADVVVRYVAAQPAVPGSAALPPRLEDLYLWQLGQSGEES